MRLTDLVPDVEGLFNLSGAISFALGVIATRVWYFIQDKRMDRAHPENAPHNRKWKSITMAWALLVIVIGYMLIETNSAYSLTKENSAQATSFAQAVKSCQVDFNNALTARSDATVAEAKLNEMERKALEDWINALFNPPPDLAQFNLSTPQRQAYTEGVTRVYQKAIESLAAQHDQVNKVRANNQLPDESTCGK